MRLPVVPATALRTKLRRADSIPTPEKPASDAPSTEVFAVFGVEPEIQAYAMAKYSRSALSMKESLREISTQKAEKFLNTFYFQYGTARLRIWRIALAVERLSILAAIEVADEQRWDGQERSTRYQDFRKSGYYTPDFGADDEARKLYRETLDFLFAEYEALSAHMTKYLMSHAEACGHEAGRVRAHAESAGLRHHSLSAAVGDQYVAGRDRQCPHSGDASGASAFAHA